MKIESYRDEPRCKTILKIEVDDDINDIEEAKELIAEDTREKLRKYWKIEEELGMPLEVLFKALKEGFYVRFVGLPARRLPEYSRFDFYNKKIDECNIKDYGKTWALTREELE